MDYVSYYEIYYLFVDCNYVPLMNTTAWQSYFVLKDCCLQNYFAISSFYVFLRHRIAYT